MSRPSLLADIRMDVRLHAPWKVSDTSLRPVPAFYPPLAPRCTVIITDSSPSVVASRISECLTKRSISVEYDEEAITATCMTADRVHFNINLYRGNRAVPPCNPESLDELPDLAHAVIVEVMRQRGSNLSFHHLNRAILNAAMGHSTGVDTRKPFMTSPLEYRRLERSPCDEKPAKRMARTLHLPHALEQALSLLKKDRIGAQRLGMESLVNLTDCHSSGKDIAIHASMTVVGAPIMLGDDIQGDGSTAEEIHHFIVRLLQDRVLPGDLSDDVLNATFDASTNSGNADSASRKSELSDAPIAVVVDDTYHGGLLRSMALRVFTNALTVLSENQSTLLSNILKTSPLTSREFVQSLAEDLLGASRLPAVVAGTRLASAHESALATRCIGLLAQHSPPVRHMLAANQTSPTLELLKKNQEVRLDFLVCETKKTYSVLSQDLRTC